MPNDNIPPKPKNVAQQETGGDCVSRLVVGSSITPETDAAFPLSENWHYPDSDEYLMRRKVAEKLEHERDGLQRAYAAAIRQMNEAIAKAEWLRTDAIADLERQRDEARSTAHLWQDRWMNDTPLEECGGTLMPWMVGWKDSSDNS